MIQIYICLFLLSTSVLSYPSININSDKFELSNEFLSQHFGSEFKDAVHFQLHRSNVIDPGNRLSKHLPENKNNGNFKRSTYTMYIPQLVKHQNHTQDNLMKVQLLHPDEFEALEKGMKRNGIYKFPAVLPDFGNMVRPNVAYHPNRNIMNPHFLPNTYDSLPPQHQQYTPHHRKLVYQQFPRPDFGKTMQPSYEKYGKTLVQSLQPSQENSMHIPSKQILRQLSQEKIMDPLIQSRSEKPTQYGTATEKPSFENITQPINEKITQSSDNKTLQHSTGNKIQPATERTSQPSFEVIEPFYKFHLPQHEKIHPTFEKIQTSHAKKSHFPFEERIFVYEPKSINKFEKQTQNEKVEQPFLPRMLHQGQISTSDFGRQPLNSQSTERSLETKQRLSFDEVRDGKQI